jgi:uncharacterized protein DUF6851/vanadium-dependent haloperoxidase-like protein
VSHSLRHFALIVGLSLSLCKVGHSESPQPETLVVQWNNAVLDAVRVAGLGPPMVARALAIVHTCIYDAWAAYDDRAMGTKFGSRLRRPERLRTIENKKIAMSYAAYRAAVDLFPRAKSAVFDDFMVHDLGYDPTKTSDDTSGPATTGIIACDAVLEASRRDGSNQLGDLGSEHVPYSDYTGYSVVNSSTTVPVKPETVKNPDHWQPLTYPNVTYKPEFLGVQWYKVAPFAGPYENEMAQVVARFPPAQYGSKAYETQAKDLIEISANLTDEQKMISEYWTDGPKSELPPGHWCLFAQFVSARDHHTLDDDTKLFFVLTNAMADAAIVSWQAKRKFDSVRPVTAIPYLFHGRTIRCWAGPGKGTMAMDGAEWMPYQPDNFPTPPFPEYFSGHSTFSSAGARILERWTGSDAFGGSVTFDAGSSRIEHGITPKLETIVRWPTFSSAADQAGMSRRYGGIHFESGDLAGRMMGRLVAERVWRKALDYFGKP